MSQHPYPTPASTLGQTRQYQVPKTNTPTDLLLAGNEGAAMSEALMEALASMSPERLRRYPDAKPLELLLAEEFGVEPSQVLATAGADDALYRICQAFLEPGRELLVCEPTFEMIPRYAALTGATVRTMPWEGGDYPLPQVLNAIHPQTHVIAVVSPNNPTGEVIDAQVLNALSQAAPHAVIILDHAYVEFAHERYDLTQLGLMLPNVIVVRTFSKAWGLAGLRVGFALGQAPLIDCLRAAGNPYAVAGPSLALAAAQRQEGQAKVQRFVERARVEREQLSVALEAVGALQTSSQANFVFGRSPRALFIRDVMAGLGISIRAYPDKPALSDALRISCPGDDEGMRRLEGAFDALEPEVLLFDMDGVMVDVSTSYREAIFKTAARFGVKVHGAQITEAKHRGDANNDWILTHRLLEDAGVEVELAQVIEIFESYYQGDEAQLGLWTTEQLLTDRAQLAALKARGFRLGIVTGRPRRDAHRLLIHAKLDDLFEQVICMEDAPNKPDPAPIALAMERMGARTAWMFGDTPDDMRSARAATRAHALHIVPWGIIAPQELPHQETATAALVASGAARVFEHMTQALHELIPS